MINMGFLVADPEFAQSITVYRQNGAWVAGRWTAGTPTTLTLTGVITIPKETDLEQVPEGDRMKGAICVYTQTPLTVSNVDGTSDQLLWANDGNLYRAAQLYPFADYGYYKCICIRMVDE
jgi:hypothetical protein